MLLRGGLGQMHEIFLEEGKFEPVLKEVAEFEWVGGKGILNKRMQVKSLRDEEEFCMVVKLQV